MLGKDLQNKTPDELKDLLNSLKADFMKLSFERQEKKLKDSSRIKKVKKDIARVMTFLSLSKQNGN